MRRAGSGGVTLPSPSVRPPSGVKRPFPSLIALNPLPYGPLPLGARQQLRRALDRRELSLQARERRALHLGRGHQAPVRRTALVRRGRVGDHGHLESDVARHPRGARDAVVGREPHEDELLDPELAEVDLEPGAEEGAAGPLLEDRLPVLGNGLTLESVTREFGAKQGVGFRRHVLHVHHRPPRFAPGGEELLQLPLELRRAPLPVTRIVEPLLDVDEEKGGSGAHFTSLGRSPASSSRPSRTTISVSASTSAMVVRKFTMQARSMNLPRTRALETNASPPFWIFPRIASLSLSRYAPFGPTPPASPRGTYRKVAMLNSRVASSSSSCLFTRSA